MNQRAFSDFQLQQVGRQAGLRQYLGNGLRQIFLRKLAS